jgi:hypothetical protein
MHGIDYWRNWTPPGKQIIEKHAKAEPTKPTKPSSVGSVSSCPGCVPIISPEAWAADFGVWMKERCAHREGKDDWGGVGGMLVDFGEWAVGHNSVPCTRLVLEALLRAAGFHVVGGMVRGLVLLADLCGAFPDSTAEQVKEWRIDGR